ncbi:hypothetical protein BB561_001381 [Smittium simulii]|uniref:Large ribosomal subunit protein uL23 N-terminal domain-containing protein n=1 Tax=Smittium simulii TaxID=133385 RepID=A0A2T9YUT1_9FUNG|nr:hypothetical protein BB561_001381 [Smittium simulii]
MSTLSSPDLEFKFINETESSIKYANITFSENKLLKSIKNRKLNDIDDLPLWYLLHAKLILLDGYLRSPFVATKRYAQLNGFTNSFFTSPFMFVTRTFENVKRKGIFPFISSNFYLNKSMFFEFLNLLVKIPVDFSAKSRGYTIFSILFNLVTNVVTYYIGYQNKRIGLTSLYLLGNYNSFETNFQYFNNKNTVYSIRGVLTHLRTSSIIFSYARDTIMDFAVGFIYTKFTKPLLSGKLKFFLKNKIKTNNKSTFPSSMSSDDSEEDDYESRRLVKNFLAELLSGNLANMIASWIFYPLEVILIKQLYLESTNATSSYTDSWEDLKTLIQSGKIFDLYTTLPFSIQKTKTPFQYLLAVKYKERLNFQMAPVNKNNVVSKAQNARKAALKGIQGQKTKKVRTNTTFRKPRTLRLARNPKYARVSVPRMASLDEFSVIKKHLVTETTMKKVEELNTLVFLCDVRANKFHIRDAVKRLYDVNAVKINTLVRPDGYKKAYVRLSPDIDARDFADKIGFV